MYSYTNGVINNVFLKILLTALLLSVIASLSMSAQEKNRRRGRRSKTKIENVADSIPQMSDSLRHVRDSIFRAEAEAEGFGALIGWTLYAPVSDQDESDEEEIEVEEIGEIIDFLDIPQNPCIEVNTKNGAVTLPLHEDLILDLDPESQEITLIIPDGLL